MNLRRAALRSLLVSCVLATGVVVAPVAAYANAICITFSDLNPGTLYRAACRRNDTLTLNQYRAVVYCTGDRYRYGTWEYMPGNIEHFGPWSIATCPAGSTRLYSWIDLI